MRSRKKPYYQIKIAKERIAILLEEARKVSRSEPQRAKRYIELAKKIGMRYNVRLTREQKRKFCKYCHIYFIFGKNAKHELKKRTVTITCLSCKKISRYPYKQK